MPTIDQLAPATAASDSDELLASQAGVARKLTRAQLVAGLQPQLAVNQGSLIGRASPGAGAPESIQVGANLTLAAGTLSAVASPFTIAFLPGGIVPGGADLVPVAQSGTNHAVSYAQFMSGLSSVPGVDVSAATIRPTGSSGASKLADFAASLVTKAGAVMTGPLTLAADPITSLQPATKQYVDSRVAAALPRTGGTLTGGLTLQAAPTTALEAATKQYVDTQIATSLPLSGGTLSGALSLPSLIASGSVTVKGSLSIGTLTGSQSAPSGAGWASQIALQRTASAAGDAPLTTAAASVSHQGGAGSLYATAAYTTTVSNAVDGTGKFLDAPSSTVRGIASSISVTAAGGVSGQWPLGFQHAAIMGTAVKATPAGGYPAGRTGPQLCGIVLPVADRTNQPSNVGNATCGAQISLSANSLDPANARIGQQISIADATPLSQSGNSVEWSTGLGIGTSSDAFLKWHILPTGNYSISVLDTRGASGGTGRIVTSLASPSNTIAVDPILPFCSAGAQGLPVSATNSLRIQIGSGTYTLIGATPDGAGRTSGKLTLSSPVSVSDGAAGTLISGLNRTIWLGSGQQIALDTAGSASLLYDSVAGTLRATAPLAVAGSLAATGSLSVGAGASIGGTLAVNASISCTGSIASGAFASSGSVSVGGTLTVAGPARLGATTVSGGISVSGAITASGTLSGSSLSLLGGIVAGGGLTVAGNAVVQGGLSVSGGAAVLPSFPVSALPAASAGALAYATNGRKPGEAAGAGSGVLVWGTASKQWLSVFNGTPVQA